MAIKITSALLKKLAPRSARSTLFQANSKIKLIELQEDNLMDWGNEKVPTLKVEVNGVPREIPAPAIMGTVISRSDLLYNAGQGQMECVDFVGNTLYNYLLQKYGEQDAELPGEITILKRVNKGVSKDQIDQKRTVYEESDLVEDGQSFDETFKDYTFIPTLFKSQLTGAIRTNSTYLINPLD